MAYLCVFTVDVILFSKCHLSYNLSSSAFPVDSDDDDDAPCKAQLSLSGNTCGIIL